MPRSLREARVLWALVLRQILRAGAAQHAPFFWAPVMAPLWVPCHVASSPPHENARCYYTMMIIDMVS